MLLSGGPEEIHFGVLWDLTEGISEPLVVIAEVHKGWGRPQKAEKRVNIFQMEKPWISFPLNDDQQTLKCTLQIIRAICKPTEI